MGIFANHLNTWEDFQPKRYFSRNNSGSKPIPDDIQREIKADAERFSEAIKQGPEQLSQFFKDIQEKIMADVGDKNSSWRKRPVAQGVLAIHGEEKFIKKELLIAYVLAMTGQWDKNFREDHQVGGVVPAHLNAEVIAMTKKMGEAVKQASAYLKGDIYTYALESSQQVLSSLMSDLKKLNSANLNLESKIEEEKSSKGFFKAVMNFFGLNHKLNSYQVELKKVKEKIIPMKDKIVFQEANVVALEKLKSKMENGGENKMSASIIATELAGVDAQVSLESGMQSRVNVEVVAPPPEIRVVDNLALLVDPLVPDKSAADRYSSPGLN